MNVQIGKKEDNKFSLHSSLNRNGEHLTDSSQENGLICLNNKKREKLSTHSYANNPKAPIDYILMNKKWVNSPLDGKAYSSFEGVSSDYHIVTAKIRLSLRRNATQIIKTAHYDWSVHKNRDISDKYTLSLRNKFNAP